MARYRGTTEQRGVGAAHAADRKRLLAQHRDGDPCWRCGQPMYKTQALDRDHVVDRALGGTTGPAVLAHASCNRSAGARLGNQLRPLNQPRPGVGHDVFCPICGKKNARKSRMCEICGAHYHPYYSEQRSCSRACGVVIARRNKMAKGWIPPAQRPKPPPRPVREPYAPRSTVTYYTCRYCGEPGVAHGTRQQHREVCPARACQLARIAANNLRLRSGLTREDADAQMAAVVQGITRPQLPAARSPATHPLWWTTVQPQRARATPPPHTCPGCGEPTALYRWCDGCLCGSVNAKGRRCGNAASTDGKCDYHAGQAGQLAASRQW